jgi:hypothetical protein
MPTYVYILLAGAAVIVPLVCACIVLRRLARRHPKRDVSAPPCPACGVTPDERLSGKSGAR